MILARALSPGAVAVLAALSACSDPDTSRPPRPDGRDTGEAPVDTGEPDVDTGDTEPEPTGPGPMVIGYFTDYAVYLGGYVVDDVPAHLLTHLLYAFIEPTDDAECAISDTWAALEMPMGDEEPGARVLGHFGQLQQLKEERPDLQVVLSVGGWSGSGAFSDIAKNSDNRARFAESCVGLVREYGFDGLDIDWEFPVEGGLEGGRPEDRENHGKLLARLRKELDEAAALDGRPYVLGAAVAVDAMYAANLDGEALEANLDWVSIMAYDMRGPWSATTGLQAQLFPAPDDPEGGAWGDEAVRIYQDMGVSPEKLVLGVPFYGRGWTGVKDRSHGLFQTWTDLPEGTWDPGYFDYWDLEDRWISEDNTFWEPTAQAPWIWKEGSQTMITYDSPESIAVKAAYVLENGLGGIMFWELSGDTSDHTLVRAVSEGLGR